MIKFSYIQRPFSKKRKNPVSKNEYKILQNQYDDFMDMFYEKNAEETETLLSDAYAFKNRLIILSIVCFLTFFIFLVYKNFTFNKYYLYAVYLICFLFVFKELLYALSYCISIKNLWLYKIKFIRYYKYHYTLIQDTSDYNGYLNRVKFNSTML